MTSLNPNSKRPYAIIDCFLCGRAVKVFLSKSNRRFYSCFIKDGGCGCQFYIREDTAFKLLNEKAKQVNGDAGIPLAENTFSSAEKTKVKKKIGGARKRK